MTRTMYDSVTPSNIPWGSPLVAGYVDGLYANIPGMKQYHPTATIVTIAVYWTDRAQVLDVEQGDATPDQAVQWCTHTMADTSNHKLTVYCNTSTWPSVRQAFQAAGVTEPNYWVAQYDNDPTIPAGAIAKQWKDAGPYDVSSVADYWPGVDPDPTPTPVPEEDDMPSFEIPAGTDKLSGVTFPEGRYKTVAFFTDNTLVGGSNDTGAKLRVVVWAANYGPEIHEISVSNASRNQFVISFTNPTTTHSVTVSRTDSGTYPVFGEVS